MRKMHIAANRSSHCKNPFVLELGFFHSFSESVSWKWSPERTLERNSLSSNPGSAHCFLVRLRASSMTSQCLSFGVYKMKMVIILATSQESFED